MTSRQTTLIKQAKERWQLYVPHEEKEKLIEELKKYQPGTHVIELDKPETAWKGNQPVGSVSKGRVVSIIFGMDISRDTMKRYLFLSDIPPAESATA